MTQPETLIEVLARAMCATTGTNPDAEVRVSAPGAEGGEAVITAWVRFRPAALRLVKQLGQDLGETAVNLLESGLALVVATQRLGRLYAEDHAARTVATAANVVDLSERRR